MAVSLLLLHKVMLEPKLIIIILLLYVAIY